MGKHKPTWVAWVLVVGVLWLAIARLPFPIKGWSGEAHPKRPANDTVGQGHQDLKQDEHGGKPHAGMAPEDMKDTLAARGRRLVMDLHCNACHLVEPEIRHVHGGIHEQIAPDLSFAGDKLRPEWLYEFLRSPHRIRPAINARMPNFRLTEREALAFTEHLITDLKDRGLPPLAGKFKFLRKPTKENIEAGRLLASKDYLDCFKCHQRGEKKPAGPREDWAPDLSLARRRLNPDWIVRWLKEPQRIQPGTRMPTFFADAQSGPEDILNGDEDRQIIALRDYLSSLGSERSAEGYVAAKKRYPDVTSGEGWKLMAELNCAGCHDVRRMHEREEVAPPLAHEGSRVRQEWLLDFMKQPHAIRPRGYIMGSEARMPGFQLSGEEAQAIAAYLMTLTYEKMPDLYAKYSAEDFAKVGGDLFAKLRCASCHEGPQKGLSLSKLQGPDLGAVGRRLQAPHLVLWLKGGYKTVDTHPLVPSFNLNEKEVAAIVAYLMTLK